LVLLVYIKNKMLSTVNKNIGGSQGRMSVYKITNNLNGKGYIGQTINSLQERFRTHCGVYSEGKCPALWSAIQLYGKDNFTIELLWSKPGYTREDLDEKEIEMIKVHDTLSPNGYNLMAGGHGSRHNDESRRKISEAKKKLWEEKGDEIRAQIKERGVSEETRKRMSEGCIRKYQERPELKEYSKNREGATHTEETRAKMAEAWVRRKQSPAHRDSCVKAAERLMKTVYIFDDKRNLIKVTESLIKAAEFMNGSKGSITAVIKKGSLYKKKYYASYDNKPPEPITKPENTIYCFDKERNLVDTCKSLHDMHEKTGFSTSGVLKNAIKGGNLYKNQFYFSYSSTLPPVSA
jgi:group I intron endonuclease